MRFFWLLLLPLVSACTDSLGFGANCDVQKREVRLREGRGPDSVQRDEVAGDHTERWYYNSGGRTRSYTFRWGVSHASCQVEGPVSFARSPAPSTP